MWGHALGVTERAWSYVGVLGSVGGCVRGYACLCDRVVEKEQREGKITRSSSETEKRRGQGGTRPPAFCARRVGEVRLKEANESILALQSLD